MSPEFGPGVLGPPAASGAQPLPHDRLRGGNAQGAVAADHSARYRTAHGSGPKPQRAYGSDLALARLRRRGDPPAASAGRSKTPVTYSAFLVHEGHEDRFPEFRVGPHSA